MWKFFAIPTAIMWMAFVYVTVATDNVYGALGVGFTATTLTGATLLMRSMDL